MHLVLVILNTNNMMTKKDYELIASCISNTCRAYEKAHIDHADEQGIGKESLASARATSQMLILALCHALKQTNPFFSESIFKDACK